MALTNDQITAKNFKEFYEAILPYLNKGYSAGDGIDIDSSGEISVDEMASADMSEIITPLPSVMSRKMRYSTDEQVVGVWVDNKPIYQKTIKYDTAITVTTTENDVTIADLSSLNIDEPVNLWGRFLSSGGSQWSIFNNAASAMTNRMYISNNELHVQSKRGSGSVTLTEIVVTIQYTKTTDTAIV